MNAAFHINLPEYDGVRPLLPSEGRPLPPTASESEASQSRNSNSQRTQSKSGSSGEATTLSTEDLRASSQAFFDDAMAASIVAQQTSQTDPAVASRARERAYKSQENAQFLTRLANTIEALHQREAKARAWVQVERRNADLRTLNASVKQQLRTTKRELEGMENRIRRLRQQNGELRQEQTDMRTRQKNLAHECSTLEEHNRKWERAYLRMRREVDDKTRDLKEMR